MTIPVDWPEGLRCIGVIPDRLRGCVFLVFEGVYLEPWELGDEPYRYRDRTAMLEAWETRRRQERA